MLHKYPWELYKKMVSEMSNTEFDGNYYCETVKKLCEKNFPVHNAKAFALHASCRCLKCIETRKDYLTKNGILLQALQEEFDRNKHYTDRLADLIKIQQDKEAEAAAKKAKEEEVPERFRSFVFPSRDSKTQQLRPTGSFTHLVTVRRAMVPLLPFILKAAREEIAMRHPEKSFNQSHVNTQVYYHGLKNIETMEYTTDEEMCEILAKLCEILAKR